MISIRIMLADDHPVVLAGMKALLEGAEDMVVVAEARTGGEALRMLQQTKPDIAVIDISLPEINGLRLAELAARGFPDVKLLALTVHEDRGYIQRMMKAGARGYLLKRSAAEELVRAIRAISDGGVYLDPAVAENLLPGPAPDQPVGTSEPAILSQREKEILQYVSKGFSNKEIGGQLEISAKTVETHKARALEKLGLHTRADIVRYGVAQRWFDNF